MYISRSAHIRCSQCILVYNSLGIPHSPQSPCICHYCVMMSHPIPCMSSICLFDKIYCHVLMVKCLLCMSINLFVFFLLVSFISRLNALSLVIFISVSIKLSILLLILLFVYMYVNIQRKASTYQMYHSQYTRLPRDKVSSL